MRLIDQMRAVRHTFDSNRGRLALTLLGIMIGSGSIVLLAGLLRGGREALAMTAQRAGDADIVQAVRDDPPTKQWRKTQRALSKLDAETLAVSQLLKGDMVTTENFRDLRAYWRSNKKRVRLTALAPEALKLNRLEVQRGRFIGDEDVAERRRVCVVGQEVWRELLDSTTNLADVQITIQDLPWTVVGVLKPKPPLGGDAGNWLGLWSRRVIIPRTTFDAVFAPAHEVATVFVRVGGSGPIEPRVDGAKTVVSRTLLRRHYGVQNFNLEPDNGFGNQMRVILMVIEVLLLGTGLLSLFVGGINIMNIMLVTVTERTREIGIRRAVGASPAAVLGQFLLEASFMSLIGGLMGVAGGILLSWTAAVGLARAVGEWNFHVETWSIALGLGLSLLTGIVFGLFPAWRAARLDPVEALRFE